MSKVYLIHRIWDGGYGGEVMGATSDKKIADAFLNQNEKYDKKAKHQYTWYAVEEMDLAPSLEVLEKIKEEKYG